MREDGTPYWLVRVLRAVLVTAPTKPCIDQQPIAAATNDMGAFPTLWAGVLEAYGRSNLFDVVSADAGFTSLANATLIDAADKGYVLGLKENQPELYKAIPSAGDFGLERAAVRQQGDN